MLMIYDKADRSIRLARQRETAMGFILLLSELEVRTE